MDRGALPPTPRKTWFPHTGVAVLLAALSALTLSAQDQPKKYDLKLDWRAVEGHRSQLFSEESQVLVMEISAPDGDTRRREEKTSRSFAATELVVKTKDKKAIVSRWDFTKASEETSEGKSTYAFQGRTVVVTKDPQRGRLFAFDNGEAVTAADAAVLSRLWGSDDKPGELSGEEIFAPKQPVGVGESWTPDVATIARGLKIDGVDLRRSTAKGILKSVESRNGADYGKMEVRIELWLSQFGPFQLPRPAVMRLTADIDACVDHTLPDGVMVMTMEAQGKGPAIAPDGATTVQLLLDLKARALERQTTIR